MYESPINVYEQISNIISDINNQKDNLVWETVAKVGVDVDKKELLKALQYDREQYSKGYYDGQADERRKIAKQLRNFICNENCGERRCTDKMDECVWVGYIDEFWAEYEKEQKNE